MDEARFTKGPWKKPLADSCHTVNETSGYYEISSNGSTQWIAVVQCEEDAHLIASAPALYEALEKLASVAVVIPVDFSQDYAKQVCADAREAVTLARQALAAARGEQQ